MPHPPSPQALFASLSAPLAQLQVVVAVPADGAPAVPVDERIRLIAGQDYPTPGPGQRWKMSNNALFEAVAGLSARLDVLTELLAATRADVLPRLLLAQASSDAATARQQAEDAQLTALTNQQQATALAVAALQAYQASALGTSATLQAATTTAINSAAAAQRAADAAQATASEAKALAQAAQASQAQLAARFRVARLATPGVAIGATATMLITWLPAFADASYSVVAEAEGTALLGLEATVTARTATGCTVQLKNSLGLALVAGAGTISLLATHD